MIATKRPSRGVLCTFAALTAIAVSACGGGGGSDPPAPQATLVVTASATTVPAGGESLDGTTWTQGTVSAEPGPNGLDPQYLQTSAVVYGNGMYVASGVQGVVTSTDGIHWLSSTAGVQSGGVHIYNLSYGNGIFLAAGYPQNYTSVDGVQWGPTNAPGVGLGAAFGNGKFVAADNFSVHTSSDGLTWTTAGSVADTNSSNWTNPRVSFNTGQFYAYGNLGVDVSPDGHVGDAHVHTAEVAAQDHPRESHGRVDVREREQRAIQARFAVPDIRHQHALRRERQLPQRHAEQRVGLASWQRMPKEIA